MEIFARKIKFQNKTRVWEGQSQLRTKNCREIWKTQRFPIKKHKEWKIHNETPVEYCIGKKLNVAEKRVANKQVD